MSHYLKNLEDNSIVVGSTNFCPDGFEYLGEDIELPSGNIEEMTHIEGVASIDMSKNREAKLASIRALRDIKIVEADILINKAFDSGIGLDAAKVYRVALRDITDSYKDASGNATSALDSVVVANFVWPIL